MFLCEGVLDALTLAQTGVRNVIATIGLGGMYWRWFKNVENLVICFDIDAAGEREFRKIARDAGLSGMTVHRLPAEIYGGKKDLNDALRADVLNGVALFDFCERHGLQEKRKVSNQSKKRPPKGINTVVSFRAWVVQGVLSFFCLKVA